MIEPFPAFISAAVEGPLDEAILQRVATHVGAMLYPIHGDHDGKGKLDTRLAGYNSAALNAGTPWIVLRDLDYDAACAAVLCRRLLPNPAPTMRFRIAVKTADAWLLADRERFARFFGLALSLVPQHPDDLHDPKQEIVNLARRASIRRIKEGITPPPGRREGRAYVSEMTAFVDNLAYGWRPDVAAQSSDSLRRCILRMRELVQS